MSEENKIATSDKMCACTVRFNRGTDEAIRDIANDNSVSYASVVRYAALGGLEKYLGNIRYLDKEQGRAINKNICEIANLTQDVLHELKKIGANYNQQVKHQHIENKHSTSGMGGSANLDMIAARVKAKNDSNEMINKVEELINRFEVEAGKLGEELWHIHE